MGGALPSLCTCIKLLLMKKYILGISFILCVVSATAQIPEDVIRYGYQPINGSARNMAIGGAMGSLGGDISALFVNPAGLGLFKTREVVLTPGVRLNNNAFNYRGTDNETNKSSFNLGPSGLIIGFNTRGSKWTSQAFSIGLNTVSHFNNTFSYKGSNNFSSRSEAYASEFSNSGLTIDDALNNPRFAFGTGAALYTYLIDTFRVSPDRVVVKGLPELLMEQGISLDQQNTVRTTGGSTELALGYAANMDDKVYVGGSLAVPLITYERVTTYRESDPTGDLNNNFNFFELKDRVKSSGVGINAKLGVIFKPKEQIRFGIAVHTPTFMGLTDRQHTQLFTDTEGYEGFRTVSSDTLLAGNAVETDYLAITPWRAMVSGSYVFREVNDTRRQRAFITADIEYVGYTSATFKATGENADFGDDQYYSDMKDVIRDYYKGAFNFRLGGELKFNTIMFRLGGAYYGSPYRDKELKSNIIQATGGLGYRDKGMFIDLSYAHNFLKDVHFPYRLSDKANTFATQAGSRGNVVLTLGFKF